MIQEFTRQVDARQAAWNMITWWRLQGGFGQQAEEIIKAVEAIEEAAARKAYQAGFRDGSARISQG